MLLNFQDYPSTDKNSYLESLRKKVGQVFVHLTLSPMMSGGPSPRYLDWQLFVSSMLPNHHLHGLGLLLRGLDTSRDCIEISVVSEQIIQSIIMTHSRLGLLLLVVM